MGYNIRGETCVPSRPEITTSFYGLIILFAMAIAGCAAMFGNQTIAAEKGCPDISGLYATESDPGAPVGLLHVVFDPGLKVRYGPEAIHIHVQIANDKDGNLIVRFLDKSGLAFNRITLLRGVGFVCADNRIRLLDEYRYVFRYGVFVNDWAADSYLFSKSPGGPLVVTKNMKVSTGEEYSFTASWSALP